MVAVPVEREPEGLLEQGIKWAARRTARSGRGAGAVAWWLAELFGTLAACAAAVAGTFLNVQAIWGWGVLVVSLLVLDTKVSIGRRKRRALGAPPVVPPAVPSQAGHGPRLVR